MLRLSVTLLLVLFASSAFCGVEEGEKAYKRNDYATAFKEFKRDDSPRSRYWQGIMYHNGEGVKEDTKEAFRLTLSAAQEGDSQAQNNLGAMYYAGTGTSRDPKQAAYWWKKAAQKGDEKAKRNLASVQRVRGAKASGGKRHHILAKARHGKSQAVQTAKVEEFKPVSDHGREPEGKDEALRWCRTAAEQGNAEAQSRLGLLYEQGKGDKRDSAEAAHWYRKAAEQGDARAQNNLAVLYLKGEGVEKDRDAALTWLRLSAAQGHAAATENLKHLGADKPQIAEK